MRWMLVLTFVLTITCVHGSMAIADPGFLANDGWRRTSNGWEFIDSALSRKSAFVDSHSFPLPNRTSEPKSRLDSHPGFLAGFQVVACILALLALPYLPRPRATLLPQPAESQPAPPLRRCA